MCSFLCLSVIICYTVLQNKQYIMFVSLGPLSSFSTLATLPTVLTMDASVISAVK